MYNIKKNKVDTYLLWNIQMYIGFTVLPKLCWLQLGFPGQVLGKKYFWGLSDFDLYARNNYKVLISYIVRV